MCSPTRNTTVALGKTQASVAAGAGLPESTLSEILLGRRRLNTRHIGILARCFRIDPGVFLDAPAE
jgi:HTH-type transcriptional regulator/antitoxin HigA